jgi:hypothetical protein
VNCAARRSDLARVESPSASAANDAERPLSKNGHALESSIESLRFSKIVEDSVKPPAAGQGRPKGALNKTTVAMKEAVLSVYADLQEEAGGNHADFKTWAKENRSLFYGRVAPRLLPLDVHGAHQIEVTTDMKALREQARGEVNAIFGDEYGILVESK